MSDRIFGLICLFVALAYIASATQIQTTFLVDPMGPKTFPIIIGCAMALASLIVILRPDPDPQWPVMQTLGKLAIAVFVLAIYAAALRPLGFIIPTAVCSAIIAYQIAPNPKKSALIGASLSVGLFTIFKFLLGLGLVAFPKSWGI